MKPFSPTLSFILNLALGILGTALGVIFLIVWWKTKDDADKIVVEIKNKPRLEIPPGMFDLPTVGEDEGQHQVGHGE
jgi:hypothetical protein